MEESNNRVQHPIQPGSPAARHALASFFDVEGINYQSLVDVSASALREAPEIAELIARAERGAAMTPVDLGPIDDPLMHKLLRRAVVTDLRLERLLVAARSCCLNTVMTDSAVLAGHLPVLVSLACQCFNNEYLYPATPSEESSVDNLRMRLSAGIVAEERDRLLPELAVYGMYRPLYSLDRSRELLETGGGELGEVIRRQIAEPLEEERLKAGIQSFGSVADPISQAVRQQYEDFPYPRWFNLKMGKRSPFSKWISRKFPFLRFPDLSQPEILIAGCGTGKHTLAVAFRHPESSVLSIDISRASLACAMRQAERYRISNVEFLHGDLLLIGQLNRTFDCIQAGGVLHHMDDPEAGLDALAGVLKPGGILEVSVYSKRAMAPLLDAQRLCGELTAGDRSPGKLRQARQAILEKFGSDPDRFFYFEFFHMGGLPDLFCPVHAKHFAPADLHRLFGKLDVEFLGFPGFGKDVMAAYRQRFPHDPYMRDLDSIESFDREFPLAFGRGLKSFYLQKKAA